MTDTSGDVALRAARRLTSEFGRGLPATVEAQLYGGPAPQRFDPGTIIAVATLILNVAQFAWDIYRDRKKDDKPVDADSIKRTIRVDFATESDLPEEQRDKVIDTIVDELLKAPPVS